MRPFMDDDFLLTTDTAKVLYHKYAAVMPIVDYHCHISPREIAENIGFENITRVWLGADHYKWRLMRSMGVEEQYITGDASDREKFEKWAWVLGRAIGNPLFHWSHLELRRYFGYEGVLNEDTAADVWELCNAKLAGMRARDLITMSGVKVVCTTDDPADDLHWHELLAAERQTGTFETAVLPAWRPDQALGIEKPGFAGYIEKLSDVCGYPIRTFSDWQQAMADRMDYFAARGCSVSDHGMDMVYFPQEAFDEKALNARAAQVFEDRLAGVMPDPEAMNLFKTAGMLFLGRAYAKAGWVMQLHFGVKRDNNRRMFAAIGPDTGFDAIGDAAVISELADYLGALDLTGELPKTILYSLNPSDNAAIGTIIGCFQNSEAYGKIQHGSAWWFNDHYNGMRDQIMSLASLGALSTSVGMLTDSRSFLSYTRHEYYRRILCDVIGTWVEQGMYPWDEQRLGAMIQDIAYRNAMAYFGF